MIADLKKDAAATLAAAEAELASLADWMAQEIKDKLADAVSTLRARAALTGSVPGLPTAAELAFPMRWYGGQIANVDLRLHGTCGDTHAAGGARIDLERGQYAVMVVLRKIGDLP